MNDFVNLHVHTNIGSPLDALVGVNELFDKAKEFNQRAIAITDHGTLTAHYDALLAYKRTGVKFIPGCENYLVDDFEQYEYNGKRRYERNKHLILLAQNQKGYKNLLKVNFEGYKNNVVIFGKIKPRINLLTLEGKTDGLICTSACANGPLSSLIINKQYEEAEVLAQELHDLFEGRFYIEIQPHLLKDGDLDQDVINNSLITISQKFGIPVICATDIHYLSKEHEKYHDMLITISSGKTVDDPDRYRYGINDLYFKTNQEIYYFLYNHYGREIAKVAMDNTIKIADSCELPDYIEQKGNHLPIFPVKDEPDYKDFLEWQEKAKLKNLQEDAAFMRYKVFKGFKENFADLTEEEINIRKERIKKEIKVMEKNNFSSYMLIVSDFICWAKENKIPVGVGRGSVSGSLAAYLLKIHGVDPIKYNLMFERFQNEERKALPDIDTDFSSADIERVKEYCRNKYGSDKCANVSNITTYTVKSVVPDLIRSMRNVIPNLVPKGENYVRISEMIKDTLPDEDEFGDRVVTVEQALLLSSKFREIETKFPEIIEYAKKLVKLPREASTHAAGMVISDVPITDYAPLRIDKNNKVVTQYEKNKCEINGMIKIDFLGLSMLDIIAEAFNNIKKLNIENAPEKMEDIPLNDVETYEMIQRGETKCVFQLGQSNMYVALCRLIKPKNIEDIAVINALGRPSCSNDERKDFADRRFSKKPINYLHLCLKNALEKTYGLCIYEEQLMVVAADCCGWNLSKADDLRRFTKNKGKDPNLAGKLEAEFIEDFMKKHNGPREQGKKIWDEVVGKFQGYGFNMSHAIAYSINSYYTAYLKKHFPAAFMAAYLKIESQNNSISKDDKTLIAKNECRRLGITLIPPDINKSSSGYEILNNNTIVMGFSSIKGLGSKAMDEIKRSQPYGDFTEFLKNTDGRIINKAKMEALAKSGCFDLMGLKRKDINEFGKITRDKYNIWRKKVEDGYCGDFIIKFANEEWSKQTKLEYEQEVLGELMSGSLSDLYPNFFTGIGITSIEKTKTLPDRHEIVVEILVQSKLREFRIKKEGKLKGQIMMKYSVVDIEGSETVMTVWPDVVKVFKEKIPNDNTPIRGLCQVSKFGGEYSILLRKIIKVYKSP